MDWPHGAGAGWSGWEAERWARVLVWVRVKGWVRGLVSGVVVVVVVGRRGVRR